jgi:hypothetical protein
MRATDLLTGVQRQAFEAVTGIVELFIAECHVPARRPAPEEPTALHLIGPAGTRAAADVWLHNTTDAAHGAIVLRITALTGHDGTTIDTAAAAFDPPELIAGPGAGVSARLTIDVPPEAAGTYHGHVLAGGPAGASLPVRLVVAP